MCVQFAATAFAASSGHPVPKGGFTKQAAREYLDTVRANAAKQPPAAAPTWPAPAAGVTTPAANTNTSAPEADSPRGRRKVFGAGPTGLKI